jgi:hypothetical protein
LTHREVASGGDPEVRAPGVEDDSEVLRRRADADDPEVLGCPSGGRGRGQPGSAGKVAAAGGRSRPAGAGMEVAGAGSEPVKAGAAGAGGGTGGGASWGRGPVDTGAFYNASVSRLATPQDGVNFIPYTKLLEVE